jgi:hypothetical protein
MNSNDFKLNNKKILYLEIIKSMGINQSRVLKDMWFDDVKECIRLTFEDGTQAILSIDLIK